MGSQVERITDRQWEQLRAFGCKVAPYSMSKVSAGRLLTYIKAGNGTFGDSPAERAGIAFAYRKKYVGKKVSCIGRYVDNGRLGVVTDLRARLVMEVAEVKKTRLSHGNDPTGRISPFTASVRWDATEKLPVKYFPAPGISLFYLELLEETPDTAEAFELASSVI